jgi:hypothetical protein
MNSHEINEGYEEWRRAWHKIKETILQQLIKSQVYALTNSIKVCEAEMIKLHWETGESTATIGFTNTL